MRKMILGGLGALLLVAATQWASVEVRADECETVLKPCDAVSCDPCGPNMFDGCSKSKSQWVYGGHMEAGLWMNSRGRTNSYDNKRWNTGPDAWSGNTELLINGHNSDAQLNQLYLYFGRKLDTRHGWDIGGQIDFMYGTDARIMQSQGLEKGAGHGGPIKEGIWNDGDYYSAISQMYLEIGYKNLSVKLGKFAGKIGHNGMYSPDRFFYSLSDAFGVQPATHSGALFNWEVNKKLDVFAGWVNGENKFFDSSDDNAFLGGFKYAWNKRISLGYAVLAGTEEIKERGRNWHDKDERDYYVHSFIVNYKPNKRWDYTFEWTLRNETTEYTRWVGNNRPYGYKYNSANYGINQELIYRWNCRWAFGGRFEWLHDSGYDDDQFTFLIGANWTPTSWLIIRPELRYDKIEHNRPFSSKTGDDWKKYQFSGGFSAVVKF